MKYFMLKFGLNHARVSTRKAGPAFFPVSSRRAEKSRRIDEA